MSLHDDIRLHNLMDIYVVEFSSLETWKIENTFKLYKLFKVFSYKPRATLKIGKETLRRNCKATVKSALCVIAILLSN